MLHFESIYITVSHMSDSGLVANQIVLIAQDIIYLFFHFLQTLFSALWLEFFKDIYRRKESTVLVFLFENDNF